MESSDQKVQSLLIECRRGADGLSRVLCMFFPGIAVIIAVMLARDFIESHVAYSVWALCSTALVGLGTLRSKSRNLPTMLGTSIAIFAAIYVFFEVVSAHPDQWIFLGWAFGMLGLMIWSFSVQFGIEFLESVAVVYGHPWRVVGMAYMIIMFSAPFALVLIFS